jgi:DNA-binding transcriptional ArsR family regulator
LAVNRKGAQVEANSSAHARRTPETFYLTKVFVKCILATVVIQTQTSNRVDVLADPGRVAAVLPPIRRRILQSLDKPDSASGLARRLEIPRQKINYHLRELERAGFVELAEERQQRGCTERLVRVTSRAFLISEDFLGDLAADPDSMQDHFSSAYLIAAAGRAVRDVATLRERADNANQKLATLAIETELSFASPADFKAFSEDLTREIAKLAARYSRSKTPGARAFRVLLTSHPVITKSERQAEAESHRRPPAAGRKNKNTRKETPRKEKA